MFQIFGQFRRDEGGNFAVITAVMLVPIMGLAGVAVDFADALHRQNRLQLAADSAALAVAQASRGDLAGNPSHLRSVGEGVFAQRGLEPDSLGVTLEPEQSTVRIAAESSKELYFPFFGDSWNISVSAKALVVASLPMCALSLASSGVGLSVGGSATFEAPDCLIHTNSDAQNSLQRWGAASASAALFCTAGDTQGYFSPLDTDCERVQDPLGPRLDFPPVDEPCGTAANSFGGGYATIWPGVYCSGIALSGTAKVTMRPGVYVIRNSPFTVGSNAQLTGDGVVIVLQGSGFFSFEAGSNVSLAGPTTGTFAGLVIAQDGENSIAGESRVHGGGYLDLTGTVYLPKQQLTVSGGGQLNVNSPQTALVVERLSFTGNGSAVLRMNMSADFTAAGYSGSALAGKVSARLIE